MKRVILMCLLCAGLTNYAQDWTRKINDPDFHNRLNKGLKVGDEMPNLVFRNMHNNKTGKTKLSDFKGKLVILDFWESWCSSCINGFPKMERLQNEFGDRIQIILVNTSESIEQVLKKNPKFKLPDLPLLMFDTENSEILAEMIPRGSLGHQVWIKKDGTIALRGSPFNNDSKTILDFLNGKSIYIHNDQSTVPKFDPIYPYIKLLGDFKAVPIKYSSTLTAYNNEYSPLGGYVENKTDSLSGTIRNTYVNISALQLYSSAFEKDLLPYQNDIIYYHHRFSEGLLRYFILPKDTSRYSFLLTNSWKGLDGYIKSRFCYEQVIPANLSEDKKKMYMQQDLTRYFGSLYGTEAKFEQRSVPCFVLVRTSNKDKLESKVNNSHPETDTISKHSRRLVRHKKAGLYIFNDLIRNSPMLSSLFSENAKNGEAGMLINETGFERSKRIDITLPDGKDLKDIDDLRKALQPYDLDIQLAKREIHFVVITDNSDK